VNDNAYLTQQSKRETVALSFLSSLLEKLPPNDIAVRG